MHGHDDVVEIFRHRLADSVRRSGLSRTEYAFVAGIDRTSLTQLLTPGNRRLPRLDTLAGIARAHGESIDWLAGLTESGPAQTEILQHTSFEPTRPDELDERLLEWLIEAADHKIRYVPATLPDLLKTSAVIRYERAPREGPNAAQTIETTAARLAWVRNPHTEFECYSSVQSITSFARGEGTWQRLGVAARREQLDRMIELSTELYPTLRWYLFDGMKRFASPVTVFGPKRAALYLGELYLVLTSVDHVRALSRHLDGLVKAASVQPPSVPQYLSRLRRELDR
jgi:transcriptional regulator with XRE-family HTH domain